MYRLFKFDEKERHFFLLLTSLIALLSFYPFILKSSISTWIMQGIFTVVLISSLMSIGFKTRSIVIGVVLLWPSLFFRWWDVFMVNPIKHSISFALGALFLMYVAAVIFKRIFMSKRVTLDIICGGLCLYLILGIIWAQIYYLVEFQAPGAFTSSTFNFAHTTEFELRENFQEVIYFSFVTMTTLGFGDTAPVLPAAKSLSMMQAVLGQFYIATLLASLMGKYVRDQD